MKAFIITLLLYIGAFIIWILDIVIPFGTKILMNIQNHSNLNTPLDLMYCTKQFLIGCLYTIVLGFVVQLIALFIMNVTKD